MSGIAETSQLAVQQAQAGATAAGGQASSNLAFGMLAGKMPNVGQKNPSTAGAVINRAADLEATGSRTAAGSSGVTSSDAGSGGAPTGTGASSPLGGSGGGGAV